jgi:hypothetical protein
MERVYRFRGDPCIRCIDEPVIYRLIQRATHHGMCSRHWLGATEAQRRDAIFLEDVEERSVLDELEALDHLTWPM